jgi:hypothetical protein
MPSSFAINEKTTGIYTANLVDENNAAIPGASLTSLTLTLYSLHTGVVVNSRDNQNVLNQNNVTVDSNGLLTFSIQEADTTILNTELATETHRALFRFGWGSNKKKSHEVDIVVTNLFKLI